MTEMFKGEPEHDQPTPPYEGRQEKADIGGSDEVTEQGVGVGGARRPAESDGQSGEPDPEQTPRGAVASPADEQPAEESGGDDPGEAATGPAHQPGTRRGEDR